MLARVLRRRGWSLALVLLVGAAAAAAWGMGRGTDQHALAEARQAGYTQGFNVGMDAGERNAREVARKAALSAFHRGWNEGALSVFGNLSVKGGRWYAVKVRETGGTPNLSAGLPLSEDQGYRLCAGEPTELCPVALESSVPQTTVIVPHTPPPLVPLKPPTPPIIGTP